MRSLWFVVALFLLALSSPTQDVSILSPRRPLLLEVVIGSDGGSFYVSGPSGGNSYASASWDPFSAPTPVAASLPLKALGGIERVSEDLCLVSGIGDNGEGRICLIRLKVGPAGIELVQSEGLGAVIPAELAWNEQLGGLAIYDASGPALFLAPFSGQTLPMASALLLIGTQAEVPVLGGTSVRIRPIPSGFVIKHDRLAPPGRYIYHDNAWNFDFVQNIRSAFWGFDTNSTKGHSGPVRVVGQGTGFAPPQSFEIRMGSTVVASGTQTTADTWVSVPAPIEFFDYPGAEFTIESSAGGSVAPSQAFRPLVRYGAPWTFGDSIKIGRGVMDPSRLFVGSGNVPISCQINLPHEVGAPAAETSYNAYLGIGFGWRGQGAPADPVTVIGDQALLTTSLMLEFPNTAQYWPIGGMSTGLPVPQDPGLEGLVVLFQWYIQSVSHPNDIAVSDVFGARIFAGGAQRAALSAPMRSAPAEGHEPARARFQQQLNRSAREGTAERFGALRGTVERRLRAR